MVVVPKTGKLWSWDVNCRIRFKGILINRWVLWAKTALNADSEAWSNDLFLQPRRALLLLAFLVLDPWKYFWISCSRLKCYTWQQLFKLLASDLLQGKERRRWEFSCRFNQRFRKCWKEVATRTFIPWSKIRSSLERMKVYRVSLLSKAWVYGIY